MRFVPRAIIAIGLTLLLVLLWYVYNTIHLVMSVESDYVATVFVVRLTADYVTEHGAWPQSWHDLEHVKRPDSSGWPADSRRIQERVVVDFGECLDELASQSANQFDAIRPIEPNELFEDANLGKIHVKGLLETIRKSISHQEQGTTP